MFRTLHFVAAAFTACFITAGGAAIAASPAAATQSPVSLVKTVDVHQAVCALHSNGMSVTQIVHNLQQQGDNSPALTYSVATAALNC